MIEIEISLEITALRAKSQQIVSALVRRLNVLNLKLQQKIVNEKLNGQILVHRSGKLAGSITLIPASLERNVITGGVQGAGGPAWYGRVHEFGGKKSLYAINPVNKKALRFMMNGKVVFAKYAFHKALPKRPFMSPSLDEMREEIVAGLQESVNEVINE